MPYVTKPEPSRPALSSSLHLSIMMYHSIIKRNRVWITFLCTCFSFFYPDSNCLCLFIFAGSFQGLPMHWRPSDCINLEFVDKELMMSIIPKSPDWSSRVCFWYLEYTHRSPDSRPHQEVMRPSVKDRKGYYKGTFWSTSLSKYPSCVDQCLALCRIPVATRTLEILFRSYPSV